MTFEDVYGCCTAAIVYGPQQIYAGKFDINGMSKVEVQDFLKRIEVWKTQIRQYGNQTRQGGMMKDFKLVFIIMTERQMGNAITAQTLVDLGFEKVFNSGMGDRARHEETGELIMLCNTPKRLNESIKNLQKAAAQRLKNIEGTGKVTEEEVTRRQAAVPLAITVLKALKNVNPNRWYLDNTVNLRSPITRRAFNNEIEEKTLGYRPDKDEVFVGKEMVTLRSIRDRAHAWREGKFSLV